MKVEMWLIDKVIPYARNPRKNDAAVPKVMASLKEYGFRQPIVVDKEGVVIVGHTRLKAAQQLGMTEVPVHIATGLTASQVKAYRIADNRTSEESEWDQELLGLELSDLREADFDLNLTGFDGDTIEKALNPDGPEIKDAEAQIDRAEELRQKWNAATGQIWTLGNHRMMCGDSTKAEDVERLLAGQAPSLVLADPPYFGKVDADWDNDFDGYEGFLEFLDGVFGLWIPRLLDRGTSGWWCAPDFAWHIEERLRKHAAVFNHLVWSKGKSLGTTASVEEMRRWRPRSERLLLCEKQHSPDALLASFNQKTAHIAARSAYSAIIDRMIEWQRQAKLSNRDIDKCLGKNGMAGHYFGRSQWALPTKEAWDKMRPLFADRGVDIGEFDAQRREFDAQRRELDAKRREFDAETSDNLTDVWEMSAPHGENRHGHPTPKPVPLISKLVSAHSRLDDLVADPFLGSGTTLIAAEQLGRKCYGMEISPAYCAVILQRWADATGGTPCLAKQ